MDDGYRDGAIYNDKHMPEFNAGFAVGCHDKQAGLLNRDDNGEYIIPANHDKAWKCHVIWQIRWSILYLYGLREGTG